MKTETTPTRLTQGTNGYHETDITGRPPKRLDHYVTNPETGDLVFDHENDRIKKTHSYYQARCTFVGHRIAWVCGEFWPDRKSAEYVIETQGRRHRGLFEVPCQSQAELTRTCTAIANALSASAWIQAQVEIETATENETSEVEA
jgi:hypothetical protein